MVLRTLSSLRLLSVISINLDISLSEQYLEGRGEQGLAPDLVSETLKRVDFFDALLAL